MQRHHPVHSPVKHGTSGSTGQAYFGMHGTYHKCLVLKLVSEVHMAYKVLAPLIRVAPGHRGTDWTYLGWQGHQYELESWLAKKGREMAYQRLLAVGMVFVDML